jgi:hypothetical protein
MKKLILTTTFLVAGVIGVMAQGPVNFSNSPFDYGDGIDRLVYEDIGMTIPVGNATWQAQLEENVGGVWTPVGGPTPFLGDVGGTFTAGIWQFVGRSLNVAGGVETQLRVAVLDQGNVLATSDPFAYTPPTSTTPPPSALLMTEFRAFGVPEPSTIALGVLGLGALLLFRRRK